MIFFDTTMPPDPQRPRHKCCIRSTRNYCTTHSTIKLVFAWHRIVQCNIHLHITVQNYAAKHRPSTWKTSVNHYEFQSSTALYGPGSVVGIATAYGLDGPGIESRWGGIFRTSPDRPWGPPSLLYNGYQVFPGGKVLPGRDADPSPPSSAEV